MNSTSLVRFCFHYFEAVNRLFIILFCSSVAFPASVLKLADLDKISIRHREPFHDLGNNLNEVSKFSEWKWQPPTEVEEV